MDRKIEVKGERLKVKGLLILLSIFIFQFLVPSCKQNNWIDWKTQNELWLQANKSKTGVRTTDSGLQYKIIADPTPQDALPNSTSTVVCDYTLSLINGCVIETANNVSLYLPNMIPGFTEGCHKIHNNGDIELYIPAFLGYDSDKYTSGSYGEAEGSGTEGGTYFIPPFSTLIFSIHICGVSGN